MISAYQSLIKYNGPDWNEYLEDHLLLDIFKPIFEQYKTTEDITVAIHYIAYAYSVESNKIIINTDWQKNKKQIFEFVLAKPRATFYEELVLLKSPHVLSAINNWMEYCNNDVFTQLQGLKDLRVEMQISSLTPIKTASQEINYDQKYRNSEYAVKLKASIKELEAELIQSNMKMKDAVKEFRNVQRSGVTVGPETFAK